MGHHADSCIKILLLYLGRTLQEHRLSKKFIALTAAIIVGGNLSRDHKEEARGCQRYLRLGHRETKDIVYGVNSKMSGSALSKIRANCAYFGFNFAPYPMG